MKVFTAWCCTLSDFAEQGPFKTAGLVSIGLVSMDLVVAGQACEFRIAGRQHAAGVRSSVPQSDTDQLASLASPAPAMMWRAGGWSLLPLGGGSRAHHTLPAVVQYVSMCGQCACPAMLAVAALALSGGAAKHGRRQACMLGGLGSSKEPKRRWSGRRGVAR